MGKDNTGPQALEVQHEEFRLLGWFDRAQKFDFFPNNFQFGLLKMLFSTQYQIKTGWVLDFISF